MTLLNILSAISSHSLFKQLHISQLDIISKKVKESVKVEKNFQLLIIFYFDGFPYLLLADITESCRWTRC